MSASLRKRPKCWLPRSRRDVPADCRSARVHRAERRSSLLTDRACSNRFFNLLLDSGHIETGTALHRWEIDERLRRLRHLLLDEHEAPELVGEPVVIGD